MDATETLKRIRELLAVRRLSREQSAELQELIEALDEWIMKGGFLPTPWAVGQKKSAESSTVVASRLSVAKGGVWPRVREE
jgi:hypothetical protein